MVFKPEIEEILEKWPTTMWLLSLDDAYRQVDAETMRDLSIFHGPRKLGPRNLGGKSKLGNKSKRSTKSKRRKPMKRPKTMKNHQM
jgi:predicted NodU family carbamoyl transferase